jgi:HD-GYP domain-containing protein (c-di-GMP phosphodiesterase class II)
VGRRDPISALPFCQGVIERNAPMVARPDDSDFSPREHEMLFMGIAKTLCLVPLHAGEHIRGLLMLGEERRESREPFTEEKLRLARSIGDQAATALHRAALFEELEQAYLQTVLALANAVDAKDTYTADHAQRLAAMALAVGQELGMSPRELEDLRYGAILHDIGKIGVSDSILGKPAKLDADEWSVMRQHPAIGARILAPVPRLAGAARIVRHHHERYDGGGYPDGLAGETIPLGARVLTVVDSYSAIVDKRVYKEARSREHAIAELKRNAGTQFDPRVVEVFLRLMESGICITGGKDS